MRRLRQQILPDPYIDLLGFVPMVAAGGGIVTAGTWSNSANRAMYVPCVFPVRCQVYALRFYGGNTTGNYDLGVYDENFNRLASKGSTALAAAVQELSLNISIPAGGLLYAALALSSTSGSIGRISLANAWPAESAGCASEDSALPLPATATPVASLIPSFPVFAWGIR